MPHYLFIYHGESSQIPSTPEDQAAAMTAWGDWMCKLGKALIDPGQPVGKSKAVTAGGVSDDVTAPAYGYSIVEAPDIDAACDMARGNPMVTGGGSVEVAQIVPM